MPSEPLAPPLFSTTKVWLSRCCSAAAISRAKMSGDEPAPLGTTSFTGLVGQSAAQAEAAAARASAAVAARRNSFIRVSGQGYGTPGASARGDGMDGDRRGGRACRFLRDLRGQHAADADR